MARAARTTPSSWPLRKPRGAPRGAAVGGAALTPCRRREKPEIFDLFEVEGVVKKALIDNIRHRLRGALCKIVQDGVVRKGDVLRRL